MTELRHYTELASTNAELRRLHPAGNLAIYADHQTGGRGQRGNVWLSAPGENLLFSLLWHPVDLPARLQFSLSEAVALAVVRLLEGYGVCAKVKWPNDIYVGDSKICGILIENAVGVLLESSIIGIGLNLNQTDFPPSLPNPTSLALLYRVENAGTHQGASLQVADVAVRLLSHLETMLPLASTEAGRDRLHAAYLASLYRHDGCQHPYRDPATGQVFRAILADVEPTGLLHLLTPTGPRRFAFKQVEYILP